MKERHMKKRRLFVQHRGRSQGQCQRDKSQVFGPRAGKAKVAVLWDMAIATPRGFAATPIYKKIRPRLTFFTASATGQTDFGVK